MALVNEHFLKLPGSYLFSDIAKKINTFRITHPKKEVIRLGIGDVTRPLPQVCIEAMHKAVDEMADAKTFRGYGPEQGYDFLIDAVIKHDYATRGVHFSPQEIFINDGAKSDTGNIGDILRHDNSVGVTDPIYPVYIDSNVMCGRAGILEKDGKWSNIYFAVSFVFLDIISYRRRKLHYKFLMKRAWRCHVINLPINQLSSFSIRKSVNIRNCIKVVFW